MSEPGASSSASGLRAIEAKPPLLDYLRETWSRIPFAAYLAWYQVFTANSRTKVGLGWVILRPLLNAGIYGLIFGLLMGKNRPDNYISFLLIGVFLYELFSATLRRGAGAVISQESLIKTIAFPRLALVVSSLIRELINIAFVLLVLLVLLLAIPQRGGGTWVPANPPTLSWLLLIPIMVIYALFCLGVSAFFARLTVHFRDLTSFLPFIIRLGLYGSGVIFELKNLLAGHPQIMDILKLNPIHAFLYLVRGALLSDYVIDPNDWIIVLVSTAIVLPVGIIYFWKGEKYYGRSS